MSELETLRAQLAEAKAQIDEADAIKEAAWLEKVQLRRELAEAKADQQRMASDLTEIQRLHDEKQAGLYAQLADLKQTNEILRHIRQDIEDRMIQANLSAMDDRMAATLLREENEALKKDAERYRFVRDPESWMASSLYDAWDQLSTATAEEFDAAIDTAIAAAQVKL